MCGEVDLTCCTYQLSLCSCFNVSLSMSLFPPAEHRPGDPHFFLRYLPLSLIPDFYDDLFSVPTLVFISYGT